MTTWNATTIAAGDYSALPTLPGVLVGQEYGFSDPGRPAPAGTVWVPIQRDDEAATYESDEDAADAYARAVGAPPDPDMGQPLAIWGVTRQEDDPDEPADMFVAVPIGAAAGIAGQTRQAPRESTIVPTIDDRGVVELPSSSPLATVCGSCGRGWLDEHTSDATPAPSGRCPFEYDHPDEDSSIR